MKPFEVEVKLLPDRLLRPQVSLALLYTDEAVYPELGTKKLADDQFEIVVKDVDDRRVGYGLGLGLTFRGLDHREGSGFAFWPVELYLNPSDSDRALGLGMAVSWKALKLSAGGIWTRHKVLDDDLELGDILPTADDLATRDSYGSPQLYVGLSVVGWPPFKN